MPKFTHEIFILSIVKIMYCFILFIVSCSLTSARITSSNYESSEPVTVDLLEDHSENPFLQRFFVIFACLKISVHQSLNLIFLFGL